MRVNHGGADVLVPQQLLYGADIVTRFQQVCRKAVAKGVAANLLDYSGTGNGILDGPESKKPPSIVPMCGTDIQRLATNAL